MLLFFGRIKGDESPGKVFALGRSVVEAVQYGLVWNRLLLYLRSKGPERQEGASIGVC